MRLPLPVLVLLASTAAAHVIPVPPSACRFDPVELSIPASGVSGTATAAGDADGFRVVFDPGASRAVFCPADPNQPSLCGPPVARNFTLAGTPGTLTLPSGFGATLLSSGDLDTGEIPLEMVLDGVGATVPISLTTGLRTAGDAVVAGTPIAGFGTFTLVGVATGGGLPAPVDGRTLVLRLTCAMQPNPDKDQFDIPARVARIAGALAATGGKVQTTLDLSLFQTLALDAQPLRLQVKAGDAVVTAATFGAGLARRGKRWVATSDDGGVAVTAVPHGSARLRVTAVFHTALALPTLAPGTRIVVGIVLDGGGLLARGEQLFHVAGRKLRPG